MSESLFRCPVCRGQLEIDGRVCRCASAHAFDIAADGYVNLFGGGSGGSRHGDDKAMVAARRSFLQRGYYSALRSSIADRVGVYAAEGSTLLDAGCGEGYYLAALRERFPYVRFGGIDISKDALRYAGRAAARDGFAPVELAVASCYSLPLGDESVDILTCVFSPLCPEEFKRVLRPGGRLIYAIPGPRHLFELKSILYERPYENVVRERRIEGFALDDVRGVSFSASLGRSEDIMALFRMTPYGWRTPPAGVARLEQLETLELTCEFELQSYERI